MSQKLEDPATNLRNSKENVTYKYVPKKCTQDEKLDIIPELAQSI